MPQISNLEKRVEAIEKRNSRVESDKSWEGSWSRKIIIALLTYLIIGSYMNYIGVNSPWINAIIPTTGFILSTLTLRVLKNIWIKYIYKK